MYIITDDTTAVTVTDTNRVIMHDTTIAASHDEQLTSVQIRKVRYHHIAYTINQHVKIIHVLNIHISIYFRGSMAPMKIF